MYLFLQKSVDNHQFYFSLLEQHSEPSLELQNNYDLRYKKTSIYLIRAKLMLIQLNYLSEAQKLVSYLFVFL